MKSWLPSPADVINRQTFVPTRLIHVGAGAANEQPRLIVPQAHEPKALQYAALSYCWGSPSNPSLTTKKASFNHHCNAIALDTTPNCIRDAIILVRKLGIQYLWIDALCIIQDDPDDWEKEAAMMGDVYRQSYVTIVAMRSESSHEGFLQPRAHDRIALPFQSVLHPPISGPFWLQSSPLLTYEYSLELGSLASRGYDEMDDSKWNRRAWVFQEKTLAPRKLFFGRDYFYASCGGKFVSEDGTEPDEDDASLMDLLAGADRRAIYDAWYGLCLGDYAERDLTYREDRLPAISGLARMVRDATGDEYLAGLWREDLYTGLLWYVNPEYNHGLTMPQLLDELAFGPYIAPSWSFACRKQTGQNMSKETAVIRECDILEAITVPLGRDPCGRLKGGSLLVRGMVLRVNSGELLRKSQSSLADVWSLCVDAQHLVDCYLDWTDPDTSEGKVMSFPLGPVGELAFLLVSRTPRLSNDATRGSDSNNGAVGALAALVDELAIGRGENILGLILTPNNNGEWFRVGMFLRDARENGRQMFLERCEEDTLRIL